MKAYLVTRAYSDVIFANSNRQAKSLAARHLQCPQKDICVEGRVEKYDKYAHLEFVPGVALLGFIQIDCDGCGSLIEGDLTKTAVSHGVDTYCKSKCFADERMRRKRIA